MQAHRWLHVLATAAFVMCWATLRPHAQLLTPYQTPTSELSFADFDGDGSADMAVRNFNTGNVAVYMYCTAAHVADDAHYDCSTAKKFENSPHWNTARSAASSGWDVQFADMNGDGLADLINRNRSNGEAFVHLNWGTDFAPTYTSPIISTSTSSSVRTMFANFDTQARADLAAINTSTGVVDVYSNIAGTSSWFASSAFISQNIAVPASGWEQLVGSCNSGDGLADFINLAQVSNAMTCHANQGSGATPFQSPSGRVFSGPPEVYEREMFLADLDGDGISDVISHDLRTGDVVGYPLFERSGGNQMGNVALVRDRTAPYMRPFAQRTLSADGSRTLSALMWYEVTYSEHLGVAGVVNGWFPLYDHASNPDDVDDLAPSGQWRTDTSLLGTYLSNNTGIITEHAYWLRALGSDAVIFDWTNCPWVNRNGTPDTGTPAYACDQVRLNSAAVMATFESIRDFQPPRVVFVIPYDNDTTTQATYIAGLCAAHPSVCYTYDDGGADRDKPLLLVYASAAASTPTWTHGSFNRRFIFGFLDFQGMKTTSETSTRSYIDDDWWTFLENEPDVNRSYYYKHVYKRMPTDSSQSEESTIWSAYWGGGSAWDGQFDVHDSRYPIERGADLQFAKPPRNLLVGRFNYMYANPAESQEGVSTNGSVYIEPGAVYTGWSVFDTAAKTIYDLKKQWKGAPGYPVVNNDTGTQIRFQSANYPTEYKVSPNSNCSGGTWTFVDARTFTSAGALGDAPSGNYYLQTRSPFGESPCVSMQLDRKCRTNT